MFTYTRLHVVPVAHGTLSLPMGPATAPAPLSCQLWPQLPAPGELESGTASCTGYTVQSGVWRNLALKSSSPLPAAQAPQALGKEEGGPAHTCQQPVGAPVPSATGGLGSATGAIVGKYSTATHRLRGPRRPTWCGRWAAGWPPACRVTQSLSGCHPPSRAWGSSVSSPRQRPAPAGLATTPPAHAGLGR